MPFNSLTFLAFFLGVLCVHALPFPWTVRKFNLLVASYLFYASWNPLFTLLLVFATVTNGTAALLVHYWDAFPGRRKIMLWLAVTLNIGLLCAFKYGNEILAVAGWVASKAEANVAFTSMNIALPVGLSFVTFQSLSYTIDVYRRQLTPAKSWVDLALFVSFFPVLLAGPLLRAGDFLSQCGKARRANVEQLGLGMSLLTLGLFMKTSLADLIFAPAVAQVFAATAQPDTVSAWIGTLAFAGQDYCDFAGYATCAMGAGLCLGFELPENFRAPFASVGFRDVWQRWHITLVAWMRDYVFFSLGGIYKGYLRAAINVMIVFLLIGLWHGAAVTYLIFGLLHGSYLIGETFLQRSSLRRMDFWNGILGTSVLWLLTMLLCCIAFVFYRSETLSQSWRVLGAMLGLAQRNHSLALTDFEVASVALVLECLIVVHWLRRNLALNELVVRVPWVVTAGCLAGMLLAMTIASGKSASFLYFQY